jgi:hypothetical protein
MSDEEWRLENERSHSSFKLMTRLEKYRSEQNGMRREELLSSSTYQGENFYIGVRSFLIEKGESMLQSANVIEQWRTIQQEYLTDTLAVMAHRALDQGRLHVQEEMTQLLANFLNRAITLKEFNITFQQKTQGAWNVFRMRGTSGGMYLNKLVKYIDDDTFTSQLRAGLRLPEDSREGQRHMQELTHYFERLITEQKVSRSHLQPARIPFFLSSWWHLQNSQHWPIFFTLVYHILMNEDRQSAQTQSPIETYFAFRTHFLSLAQALGVSSWEMEHLVTWKGQQSLGEEAARKMTRSASLFGAQVLPVHAETVDNLSADGGVEQQGPKSERELSEHTYIQWLLAKIGHQVGCDVWIAANDQSKSWNGERLGDLSLKTLPPLLDSLSRRFITLIDVLWLRGEDVIAAYEIEHTTSISSGLLRLYDLDALYPTSTMHLCIVVPNPSLKRIQAVLARPAFQRLHMQERCLIIQEETLLQQAEHILRWASSPSVITRLALSMEKS